MEADISEFERVNDSPSQIVRVEGTTTLGLGTMVIVFVSVIVVLQESYPLTVSVKIISPVAPTVGKITGFKSF